jgi:hypothetical protein
VVWFLMLIFAYHLKQSIMKPLVITKEDQLQMQRKASREAELSQGRISLKCVHKSKKTYGRKKFNVKNAF